MDCAPGLFRLQVFLVVGRVGRQLRRQIIRRRSALRVNRPGSPPPVGEMAGRDRREFRKLLPAGGCIDQCELADFRRRTLPAFSERIWAKCAASCPICGGVATASRKATSLPAVSLSNRCELAVNLRAVGVVGLSARLMICGRVENLNIAHSR